MLLSLNVYRIANFFICEIAKRGGESTSFGFRAQPMKLFGGTRRQYVRVYLFVGLALRLTPSRDNPMACESIKIRRWPSLLRGPLDEATPMR